MILARNVESLVLPFTMERLEMVEYGRTYLVGYQGELPEAPPFYFRNALSEASCPV